MPVVAGGAVDFRHPIGPRMASPPGYRRRPRCRGGAAAHRPGAGEMVGSAPGEGARLVTGRVPAGAVPRASRVRTARRRILVARVQDRAQRADDIRRPGLRTSQYDLGGHRRADVVTAASDKRMRRRGRRGQQSGSEPADVGTALPRGAPGGRHRPDRAPRPHRRVVAPSRSARVGRSFPLSRPALGGHRRAPLQRPRRGSTSSPSPEWWRSIGARPWPGSSAEGRRTIPDRPTATGPRPCTSTQSVSDRPSEPLPR